MESVTINKQDESNDDNNCAANFENSKHATNFDWFDEVMAQVGESGNFQKVYNTLYNFVFVIVATMAGFSIILTLATPEHWCLVPGRSSTNYSLDEWRTFTVPRKPNSTRNAFENCKMFNGTVDQSEESNLIGCQHGWEYDHTYYGLTLPSQMHWVCEKELLVANSLMFTRVGEILGSLILGQASDIFGRKPILFLSIVTLLIGRLGSLVTTGIYPLFVIFVITGSLSGMTIYQTTAIISMEMSQTKDVAKITFLQTIGWTIGLCLSPFVFWISGDWVTFTLITTLPLVPFLFCYKYNIESPRWLVTRGKLRRCTKELRKIANANKSEWKQDVLLTVEKTNPSKTKAYGALALFSTWNLTKRTLIVILEWICCSMIYLLLYFNVGNTGGNPLLNYFWQGLAELPGYVMGKYLCDTLGRRKTIMGAFVAIIGTSFCMSRIINLPDQQLAIYICGMVAKLLACLVFYTVNLQSLEIYPTCMRQTAISVAYIIGNIFSLVTPYIIYLGTSINLQYPYIFAMGIATVGCLSGWFMPETLNQKLPETIEEADRFGIRSVSVPPEDNENAKIRTAPQESELEPKKIDNLINNLRRH